ncbi:alkaline phosphatase family protein [Novosphingobium album (ex Hu et al. 2023)]|uniref:Alkaline phosphatase n=1 Tax=Novosphingobium album (ex Hu et al. 2023) TaxID=2930093 RepID=A0ABT0AZL1_9SPHN|nr:alkaline phosphatase family protein [Novosphingobium album (ex Hu et al. 2023)]MCJ2178225.1 alkaline phosphatase family protein [Novosphingobium album (ex Hu et al. 2023)]
MRLALPLIALATALSFTSPALADETPAAAPAAEAGTPAAPPRLIVAISVDQFSADLFAQYRAHFSKGFERLLQGAVFPSGYQSHAATETCPGHSTLLTGVHPARTGIVANNWYVPGIGRKDKKVYCVEDEANPASTSKNPVVSPKHLKAPTLGDLMKKANPATINAAVSAKDRAAVMMSGHDTDAVYWFEGKGFTTFEDRKISPAVEVENAAVARLVDAGDGDLPVPGFCGAVDHAVKVKDFTIGTYRFPLKPEDYRTYAGGPRLDAATGDLAIRMVDELGMGKDAVPDVLSVSFSQTDRVGHAFGHEGVEMCIQLAQLDATLGKLFDALDARGIDYAVVLSADHGGFDAPERLNQEGYAAAKRISADLKDDALSDAVSRATGITAPEGKLLYGAGSSGDIYLGAGLTAKQRKKVTSALVALLKANPEVEAVYTAEELKAVPVPQGDPQDWTMVQRVRASFDPERSGEVLMMTRRGVVGVADPAPGYVATHGSPWDYDRRVPIVFWRKGMAGEEQPAPVETVDIAPTLAALVGLKEPAGTWDGTCLDIDGSEADTCAR